MVCVVVTPGRATAASRRRWPQIAKHPDLELQLVVGASALLDRYGRRSATSRRTLRDPRARLHGARGENLASMPRRPASAARARDGLRQPEARRRRHNRGPLRNARDGGGRLLHEHPGGARAGRRDHRLDRRKGASCRDEALQPPLRGERARGESCGAWARIRDGVRDRLPSIDLAAEVAANPEPDFDPIEKYGGVGVPLDLSEGYIVVLQHPVTTSSGEAGGTCRRRSSGRRGRPAGRLWFWPNVDAARTGPPTRSGAFAKIAGPQRIHFFKNMAPTDFLSLVLRSRCLVGNSSVGIASAPSSASRPSTSERARRPRPRRNVRDTGYCRGEIAARSGPISQRPLPQNRLLRRRRRGGEDARRFWRSGPSRSRKGWHTHEGPRLVPARGRSAGDPGAGTSGSSTAGPARLHRGGRPEGARTLARHPVHGRFGGRRGGRRCGLEMPFLRPQELATDEAPALAVVQHALNTLEERGERFDAVCLLQRRTAAPAGGHRRLHRAVRRESTPTRS